MDFDRILEDRQSREVVAQEDFPKEGILMGDILIVRYKKPLPGELIMVDATDSRWRNASGGLRPPPYSLRYFVEGKDAPLPGREGFRGVVVGLYRRYRIEESAHGPS